MRLLLLLCVMCALLPVLAQPLPDGLILRVRADAGVVKDDQGRVATWKDQSGKGNDFLQADPALQPLLVTADNGLPAIRFDGADDTLSLATSISVTGKSVFAVVKWNKVKGYSFPLGLDAGTDGYLRMSNATELLTGGRYPMLYQNSLPSPKVGYAPGDGRFIFHKGLRSLLQWNVYAITDNPPSAEKLKHFGKNELNNVPENRFDGEIAEVLVFDRALSGAERLKVEEYLERQYLGWTAMATIPVTDAAGSRKLLQTPLPDGGYVPLNQKGRVFAQGVTAAGLPAGRYRLHYVLRGKFDATDTFAVRVNDSVMTSAAGENDFIIPVGAPDQPTLVRVSWEGKTNNAPGDALASVALLHIERLSPLIVKDVAVDKILYSPNGNAVATAVIHNYAAEALKADIRFTEVTGLDDRRVLGALPVEVAAGGEATVTLPYNVSATQYGRDLLVEIVRDDAVVEAKSDSYSVADNVWKVAVGASQIGTTADYTPDGIVKQMQEVRRGYGNWVEKDFWAPDDWGLMVTAPGATWFSGQARRHENTEKLQLQVKAAHDLGIKVITYGKCMAGGLPGWELARTRPQWFTTDGVGRTIGRPADVWDMEHWQEADKYKYTDFKYAWTYRWVDLRQMAPLEHGIDQLIASAKQFGWDGVRYDSGGFRAHWVPKDGAIQYDGVDSYNARNMRYTKERVWKALPGFLFGVNTNDPVSGENACPLLPTDKCGHEFREMLAGGGLWMFEGLRDKPDFWGRRTYKTWSDYAQDMATTMRTIRGYGGHACGSYGDTELYKFVIGTMVGCHDYMGEHLRAKGSENWGRFLTRWSRFIWDTHLRALPAQAYAVNSARPVWHAGYANELVVSPSTRYTIIHLLNPPVNDVIAKTKDEVPAPVDGIGLSLTVGKEKLKRVLFIAPGTPNRVESLTWRNGEAGVAEISVPRLDVWGMMVAEFEGKYTMPADPPALTEPLSAAEQAEMAQCAPPAPVPVADNLANPTPPADLRLAVRTPNLGAPTVTPSAGLTVGGEPGADVLLIKGFYHYTWRLPEALKATAARVTECTSRDLPKDYPDLFKYDTVALIDMGAEYWDANGQQRLADYVRAGGRLVVFGGPFTLGQGFFKDTPLAAVLPVEVRAGRDVFQAPKPLALQSGKRTYPGNPLLYYFHAVTPKAGATTLLSAGEAPILVQWCCGKGTAAVFAGTTMGEAAKGETPFWQWDGWLKLVAGMLAP